MFFFAVAMEGAVPINASFQSFLRGFCVDSSRINKNCIIQTRGKKLQRIKIQNLKKPLQKLSSWLPDHSLTGNNKESQASLFNLIIPNERQLNKLKSVSMAPYNNKKQKRKKKKNNNTLLVPARLNLALLFDAEAAAAAEALAKERALDARICHALRKVHRFLHSLLRSNH